MKTLFIDIETIPTQDKRIKAIFEEYSEKEIKAPANYKDEAKIAEYIAAKKEEAFNKLSFDGAMNQIICVGIAFGDLEIASASCYTDEKELLNILRVYFQDFNCDTDLLVGHNIIDFDLRVLYQRYIVNGIKPPTCFVNVSRYSKHVFDTMTAFAGFGNRIRLDKLARILGFGGKDGMDGSQVYEYWQAGRADEIADYCQRDVEMVRDIYSRMTFQGVA